LGDSERGEVVASLPGEAAGLAWAAEDVLAIASGRNVRLVTI